MSIYKYVRPERVDILRHEHIRFSQASVLNDPIETRPVYEDIEHEYAWPRELAARFAGQTRVRVRTRLAKASGDGHSYFYRNFDLTKGDMELHRLGEYLLTMAKKTAVAMGENIGVLSLTETPDNLLMWAHYAQQHEGFVLECDERHDFFAAHKNEMLGPLLKVAYSVDRPARRSLIETTLPDLFLTKSKEWGYENEWRALRNLKESDLRIANEKGTIHLFSLPANCVLGIILGCRMSEQTKRDLITLITEDERYEHVNVSEATVDPRKYQLNISRIEIEARRRRPKGGRLDSARARRLAVAQAEGDGVL